MKIGIGIDTGGTYTDGVVYDFEQKKILASAKALTTIEDLSIGIGNTLDKLPLELLQKAEIASLSTTLATNACVENKGGRAKLLFIDIYKKVVDEVGKSYGLPDTEEIFFLNAQNITDELYKNSSSDTQEPDWNTFIINSREWLQDADAVAIVELDAIKNNAEFEKKAKTLIEEKYDIPVICGHELSTELNSIQRGSSTLLNARLIPVIKNFLKAINETFESRNIKAPIVIVRSDGSVMSEEFTGLRAVETILSGPASSVMGGIELTNQKDCLIIDMGGTTTDMSIVRNGVPVRAEDGVNIGKWRTFVKGVYIDTFGLGGDSAIRFDKGGHLLFEPVRVVPLAIAAEKWPVVIDKLKELVSTRKRHTLLLHEFFWLTKDISNNSNYTEAERKFCQALKKGPLIFSDAAAAIGTDVYNLNMERLEKEGIVARCGLTPTDIMHIKGDFTRYDATASKLGAEFVAANIYKEIDELVEMAYDKIKKTLYMNIIRMLLEEKYPYYIKHGLGKGLEILISESWEMTKKLKRDQNMKEYKKPGACKSRQKRDFLEFNFSTPPVLVGIGAPIHIFLPDVAEALGTKCIIPENAGVANALGTIVSKIIAVCTVEIKPEYSSAGISGYTVYGREQNIFVTERDEAIRIALDVGEKSAIAEAKQRGASSEITITSEVITETAESRESAEIFLGIKVIVSAIGRVSFGL